MSGLGRLAGTAAAVLLVAAVLAPGVAAAAVRPGTTTGATVVKTGWWWRPNDATPVDDTSVGAPQPSAPRVPEGSLPVAAAGGEPEKMAAIEFGIKAEPGSTVDSFTLVLRENADPGSNVNQENGTVVACPVTDAFWAHGDGARWHTRPGYDCRAGQAAGQRKDGVWTFDLTALAQAWTSGASAGAPAVVLVEGADAPQTFQATFDGVADDGIGLHVQTSPPTGGGPAFDVGGPVGAKPQQGTSRSGPAAPSAVDVPDVGGGMGPVGGPGSLGGPGSVAGLGSVGTGSAPSLPGVRRAGAPVDTGGDVAPALAAPRAQLQTQPVAAAPAWYAGLPWAGYLLLPLGLALAYLLMLALGPDAQPVAARTGHGVSRALERLQRIGRNAGTRGGPG